MAQFNQLLSITPQSILQVTGVTEDYSYNSHMYEVDLFIVNSSTGNIYKIAPTSVHGLNIESSLATWVTKGSLTITYDNELAEYINNFVFRNDGEDIIRFRIIPKDDKGSSSSKLGVEDKKIWELNYIFSIYDVQDVTPQGRSNTDSAGVTRLKKFLFWDIRYQVMLLRDLEYSTALSDKVTTTAFNQGPVGSYEDSQQYKDINRSILTHEAMEEIIKDAFLEDPILGATAITKSKEDEWDVGATKIFYTSSTSNNAFEDLMYIHSRHVSNKIVNSAEGRDYSVLSIERDENSGIGYFALIPLTTYFDKAGKTLDSPGPYQLEHFFLKNDIPLSEQKKIRQYRSPILKDAGGFYNDMKRDIKIGDYNIIDKYEFVDISPYTNTTGYKNISVHSFDFTNRTFNIERSQNSINAAEQAFSQSYISKLFQGRGGDGKNNFLLNTQNPLKLSNSTNKPTYSLYGDNLLEGEVDSSYRQPEGLHRLLRVGLFQNTAINFTVPGLTFRRPGRFIAIDRFGGSEDNNLDDKLCGQWFVIKVMHTFAGGMYYNNITAVKTHRFQAPGGIFSDINQPFVQPPKIGLDANTSLSLTQPGQSPQFSLERPSPFTLNPGPVPPRIPITPDGLDSRGQPPANFNPPPDQLPITPPL